MSTEALCWSGDGFAAALCCYRDRYGYRYQLPNMCEEAEAMWTAAS